MDFTIHVAFISRCCQSNICRFHSSLTFAGCRALWNDRLLTAKYSCALAGYMLLHSNSMILFGSWYKIGLWFTTWLSEQSNTEWTSFSLPFSNQTIKRLKQAKRFRKLFLQKSAYSMGHFQGREHQTITQRWLNSNAIFITLLLAILFPHTFPYCPTKL